MRTAIALICLTGPSLYLAIQYLRDYGLAFGKEYGWGVWRVLALVLLLAHVYETVSGRSSDVLDAEFFPFRGFLFFAVSGVAYGAAIFPRIIAEKNGTAERLSAGNRNWVVAIPAWIWIAVLIGLAVVQYAG